MLNALDKNGFSCYLALSYWISNLASFLLSSLPFSPSAHLFNSLIVKYPYIFAGSLLQVTSCRTYILILFNLILIMWTSFTIYLNWIVCDLYISELGPNLPFQIVFCLDMHITLSRRMQFSVLQAKWILLSVMLSGNQWNSSRFMMI